MNPKAIGALLLGMSLIVGLLPSCKSQDPDKLTLAAAANLGPAMQELIQVFDSLYGQRPELVLNSSGKLSTQIEMGAPFHLFLSADMAYPQRLFSLGLGKESPKAYALGQLVLLSKKQLNLENLDAAMASSTHVAIANPQLAPYGRGSKEFLTKEGLWDKHQQKFIFGESIGQTTQFFVSGAADMVFTSMSMVGTDKATLLQIPDSLYTPIQQAVLLLNSSPEMEKEAKKFYNFLFSPAAQSIFKKFGYKIPQHHEPAFRQGTFD